MHRQKTTWRAPFLLLMFSAAAALAGGCGKENASESVCIPNSTRPCSCADGSPGARTCLADGSDYTACQCVPFAAGTGGAGIGGTGGFAGVGGTGGVAGTGGTGGIAGSGGTGGVAPVDSGVTGGTGGVAPVDSGPAVDAAGLDKFSFFVTSLKVMLELSGSSSGFGGNLRYGETGAGAGLRGADKICSTIAEKSMPGSSAKVWRAFLSATADENGVQVNAVDRVGNGPWYDRYGRVFALTKTDLLNTRPANADAAIVNDFPNEDGVPNHNPDLTGQVDNHDFLTGTGTDGKLYDSTATCKDWTTSDGSIGGKPRVGHSWPRGGGGGWFGGGGGMGDMDNWMSALDESGCAPGVFVMERGGPVDYEDNVGSGGGYGGFYCFALTP